MTKVRTRYIQARSTPEEIRHINALAAAAGLSTANYIRKALKLPLVDRERNHAS